MHHQHQYLDIFTGISSINKVAQCVYVHAYPTPQQYQYFKPMWACKM